MAFCGPGGVTALDSIAPTPPGLLQQLLSSAAVRCVPTVHTHQSSAETRGKCTFRHGGGETHKANAVSSPRRRWNTQGKGSVFSRGRQWKRPFSFGRFRSLTARSVATAVLRAPGRRRSLCADRLWCVGFSRHRHPRVSALRRAFQKIVSFVPCSFSSATVRNSPFRSQRLCNSRIPF